MSIINSDQFNADWQLRVLKGLQGIVNELNDQLTIVGDVNSTIVAPLGIQGASESVSVALCKDQYASMIKPGLIISTGEAATLIDENLRSISFASNGTADALITVDGGTTYLPIPTGTTINFDAGAISNYYPIDSFGYDTATNAGASLIVTYNVL